MIDYKNVGLEISDIKDIVKVIEKNQKVEKLVLFGSRAKGEFGKGSDIDLAIQGADIDLNDTLDLSIELDNLLLPYKIDLIIFNRIEEPSLIEHIKRVGITLFERV